MFVGSQPRCSGLLQLRYDVHAVTLSFQNYNKQIYIAYTHRLMYFSAAAVTGTLVDVQGYEFSVQTWLDMSATGPQLYMFKVMRSLRRPELSVKVVE